MKKFSFLVCVTGTKLFVSFYPFFFFPLTLYFLITIVNNSLVLFIIFYVIYVCLYAFYLAKHLDIPGRSVCVGGRGGGRGGEGGLMPKI